MSEPGQQPLTGLYVRLGLVVVLVVAASIAGYWLGAQSAPSEEEAAAGAVSTPAQAAKSTADQPAPATPPLYFFTSVPSSSARSAVAEEISMAASAGIHQYAVSVPFPTTSAEYSTDMIGIL